MSRDLKHGHTVAQQSWVNSMKGSLEIMQSNCQPDKGELEGEKEIVNNLALAIQKAEDFYNAQEV